MPHVSEKVHTGRHFLTNPGIEIECGFGLTSLQLTKAVADANNELGILPRSRERLERSLILLRRGTPTCCQRVPPTPRR
jgi:hypothetical protein